MMQLLPGSAYSHCHRWRSKCSLTDKNNNELIERKIYQRMLKNVTMETTNVQLPARSNIRQSTYAKLIFHMFTDKSFPPTVNRYLPSLLHMISETYSRQKANKITLSINRIAINFPHKGKKGDFTARWNKQRSGVFRILQRADVRMRRYRKVGFGFDFYQFEPNRRQEV